MTRDGVLAYIGLGGNLGDVCAKFDRALAVMGRWPDARLLRVSRAFRNPPMGPADQPDYINAVAALHTTRSAIALLDALQALEVDAGRVRGATRWQARELDLDLLLYGSHCIDEARLTVPHPGAHQRAFVLGPLAEIAADLCIPGQGMVSDLIAGVDHSTLTPLSWSYPDDDGARG